MVWISSFVARLSYPMIHPLLMVALVWKCIVRLITYIAQPWCDLFWSCYNFHVAIGSAILSFGVKVVFLPVWILTLFEKEKWLEAQIRETQMMQDEFEERNRELESKLDVAIRSYKRTKDLLEVSEKQKKVIMEKCQLLHNHIMQLEEQNDALKAERENIAKSIYDGKSGLVESAANAGYNVRVFTRGKKLDGNVMPILQHDLTGKLPLELDLVPKLSVNGMQRTPVNRDVPNGGRALALTSSLFSAFLSLLVGMVTWKAQDPCMPLVLAVFSVVCMSLKNVTQFLISSNIRLGFDAVALMSFNWFLLGTLAYPVLPNIAQAVSPFVGKFGHLLLRVSGVYLVAERFRSVFM